MKENKQKLQHLHSVLSVLLIISLIVLNVQVNNCWAIDEAFAKRESGGTAAVNPVSSPQLLALNDPLLKEDANAKDKKAPEPQSQKTNSSNTILYAGIGVAAAVAVAAVAAGSGGGSDSETVTTPATTTTTTTTTKPKTTTQSKPKVKTPSDNNPEGAEPVGADIGGDNWSGFIDLVGGSRENISASIYQHGDYVRITTTSHQEYGQKLVGNISSDGFIRVYDQRTGELWTTHYDKATAKKVDLYDYVDNYKGLDQIFLQR